VHHEGGAIDHGRIHVTPDALPAVPARSTRGVAVTVDAADEVRDGVYRGMLLTRGRPELWLPVAVTVQTGRRA
jgi:hypothetical protein